MSKTKIDYSEKCSSAKSNGPGCFFHTHWPWGQFTKEHQSNCTCDICSDAAFDRGENPDAEMEAAFEKLENKK